MSYRNPQQYGIVEDMTAGTRAFQKGFGQVQGVIEKNKKEREEEGIRRDTDNANWVKETSQEIAKYKYLKGGFEDVMREMITKDIGSEFFDKKSKTKQALLMAKLSEGAEYGNDFFQLVEQVKKGEIELDNPEMMKYIDSVGNDPKYGLDKNNNPTLNGVQFSVIMQQMKNNNPVQGSKQQTNADIKTLADGLEKKVKNAVLQNKGPLSNDQLNKITEQHVAARSDIYGDSSMHWLYKNVMTSEERKVAGGPAFNPVEIESALTGEKTTIGTGNEEREKIFEYNYNGSGITNKEKLKDFENRRDESIKNYMVQTLKERVVQPYYDNTKDQNLAINKEKLELATKDLKLKIDKNLSEEQNLRNLKQGILNTTSGYVEGGNKEKSNEQLTADLSGIPVDGLPGISGTGTFIRNVQRMPTQGADGKFEVKIQFGKLSGLTDVKYGDKPEQTFIIDLNDKEIQRKLGLNMSMLDGYGDFRKDLSSTFLKRGKPENNDFSQQK